MLFANAQVQDLAKWGVVGRDIYKGGEARQQAMRKVFRAVVLAGIGSLLQAAGLALGGDDWREKYKDRLDWEKETYWFFGGLDNGIGVRIPKGQDLATRFLSALFDEWADKFMHDDPVSAKRLFKVLKDATPSIIPTLIEPYVEARDNYAAFRDAPIVPTGELNRAEWEQYGKNTSALAKTIGKAIGNTFINEHFLSASPRKIDHMINGYFGTFGKTVARLPDMFTRGWNLEDAPVVSRFVFDATRNSRVVKEYYEILNKQHQLKSAYESDRKEDRKAVPPDGYDPKLYARLDKFMVPLRKISKTELNILKSSKLDWDAKNKKLSELEKRREELCRKALNRAR